MEQFFGILSCLSRHPNLLCKSSKQFSRMSPILHQLCLVFLHLTCVFHLFSSCLEWNPLLHNFSPVCVSCPVWTWHTRKLSKFTLTHPVESVFRIYIIPKKKKKTWAGVVQYVYQLTTNWVFQGSNPSGVICSSPVHTGPDAHPTSCTVGTGCRVAGA